MIAPPVLAEAAPEVVVPALDTSEDAIRDGQQTWLANEIQAALLENPELNPFDIRAQVTEGRARLEGEVSNAGQRQLAEQIALTIEGIDSVDNRIQVSTQAAAPETTVEDSVINAAVSVKIMANDELSRSGLSIETRDGVVTLQGEVQSEQEKQLATDISKQVEHVKAVDNQIRVRKP